MLSETAARASISQSNAHTGDCGGESPGHQVRQRHQWREERLEPDDDQLVRIHDRSLDRRTPERIERLSGPGGAADPPWPPSSSRGVPTGRRPFPCIPDLTEIHPPGERPLVAKSREALFTYGIFEMHLAHLRLNGARLYPDGSRLIRTLCFHGPLRHRGALAHSMHSLETAGSGIGPPSEMCHALRRSITPWR